MSLIGLVLVLAVFGLAVWAIVTYVPMPPPIRSVIVVIAALGCVFYVLQATGLLHTAERVRV